MLRIVHFLGEPWGRSLPFAANLPLLLLKGGAMRSRALHWVLFTVVCPCLLCLLQATAPRAKAAPMFMGLGDLPGGNYHSSPSEVSADGSTVVGSGKSDAGSEAFRWTAETGMVGLGDLPGGDVHSTASGVSADGSVVVGRSSTSLTPSDSEAFLWTAEMGMVGLGDLPGGDVRSAAFGVSADGSVVVGSGSTSLTPWANTEAFRWTAETRMVGLGDLPGGEFSSRAIDTSADGSTVVGDSKSTFGIYREAFIWTADDGMVGLGGLSGPVLHSYAEAVSADGSVVVGGSNGPDQILQAFRWTEAGGMIGLGGLWQAYPRSWAEGVSADGGTVVGSSTVGIGPDGSRFTGAFIWDSTNGMRNLQDVLTSELGLDLTGWSLNWAKGISADGRTIIGAGYNPSGDIEGWIATIPEPSTAVLLAIGLAGLAAAGRGRSIL